MIVNKLCASAPRLLQGAALVVLLGLGGCGDGSSSTCEAGTLCPCGSNADCSDGEICDPFAAVCVPEGAQLDASQDDAGDTSEADIAQPDAGGDATEDVAADSTEQDAGDDAGADTTSDALADAGADVDAEDADAADADATDVGDEDVGDTVEDVDPADADADAEADVEEDAFVSPRPDPVNNPWVAFTSDRPSANDPDGVSLSKLFVVRFDRFNLTEIVTPLVAQVDTPTWRPDGRQIASTVLSIAGRQLWLYDVETGASDVRTIPGLLRFFAPQYSPDGEVIAVEGVEEADQLQGIYRYNLDSESLVKISGDERAGSFTWHPSGRIYHLREAELGSFDVFRMNSDGSDVVRVTEGSRILGGAAVNWEQSVLWYVRVVEGTVDESELVRHDLVDGVITVLGGNGIANPRLSIDDRFLVVTQDDGEDLDVAVLDADSGIQLSVLTRSDEADGSAAIAPVESGPILVVSGE